MNNRFAWILATCAVVFLGLVIFIKRDSGAPAPSVTESNHVQGEGTAGVTLVEYGDFQCPACGGYYPLIKEVKEKYGDQITFQFRHFPIVGNHPNAMAAHRAAEAAGLQDKFWEMHDILYERQSSWQASNNAPAIFREYAEEIGLDMDRYNSDIVKPEISAVIQKDMKAGQDKGVSGTPTFFINDELVDNSQLRSLEDFSKLIDEAMQEQENN